LDLLNKGILELMGKDTDATLSVMRGGQKQGGAQRSAGNDWERTSKVLYINAGSTLRRRQGVGILTILWVHSRLR
jgi:hypothetical protein